MKLKVTTICQLPSGAICAGAILLMASSASAQNLFVSTYNGSTVQEITPGGAQSTFASGMDYPYGLVFNGSGDLFVANSADDGPGGYITEITPGGVQSTFATGVDPKGLAMNTAGNLFEADYLSGNIYEYAPNGTRSTFATGFQTPQPLAFNSAGDLFVGAGYGNNNGTITEITPGGAQSVFATGLTFPDGLAFNSAGDLFVSSASSGTIYEYSPGGARNTFATLPTSTLEGLAFNSAGDLFAASSAGTIYEITPGGTQSTFASVTGTPVGLAVQPVPEPSVLASLGVGTAALLIRLRRITRLTQN